MKDGNRLVRQPFIYHGIDVRGYGGLPDNWQQQLTQLAQESATTVILTGNNITSRELTNDREVYSMVVGGLVVKAELPWLYNAYHSLFLELAAQATGRRLCPAQNDEVGVVLNVMTPHIGRYDAHVDSNPLQGMLYAQTASGGELVVTHNINAVGIAQIEADASVVNPASGHVYFFDGRVPHYVRPVTRGIRVAAAMNYYDESSTEADRPPDLNDYLKGI